MSSSKKYPYLTHIRDFFQDPPPLLSPQPLWKFQLSFRHFLQFFLSNRAPHPLRKFQSILWGSMDVFWNCPILSKLEIKQNRKLKI